MDDHDRRDDVVIDIVREMLKNHIAAQEQWNREHDEKAEAWRTKIDNRFRPLEDFVNNISIGWKIMIGFTALVGSSWKIFTFIRDHFK